MLRLYRAACYYDIYMKELYGARGVQLSLSPPAKVGRAAGMQVMQQGKRCVCAGRQQCEGRQHVCRQVAGRCGEVRWWQAGKEPCAVQKQQAVQAVWRAGTGVKKAGMQVCAGSAGRQQGKGKAVQAGSRCLPSMCACTNHTQPNLSNCPCPPSLQSPSFEVCV